MKVGYKSEYGAVGFAAATTGALLLVRQLKVALAAIPVWAILSRLIARGSTNRARAVTVGSPKDAQSKARVVLHKDMTLKERPLAVVTGTNSGIGYYTAVGLAVEGYVTVITCRSRELAYKTASRIRTEAEKRRRAHPAKYANYPETVVVEGEVLECDNFKTVRAFAKWFTEKYGNHNFQVLVNNAGGMVDSLKFSKHAPTLEHHTAVNFLGPLLLTDLLLPLLEKNGGRVVNVSSAAHRLPQYTLDGAKSLFIDGKVGAVGLVKGRLLETLKQLNQGDTKAAGPLAVRDVGTAFARYGTSKLLNIYHAHVIARRYLKAEEAHRVYACSLHPGCVASNFPNYLNAVPGLMTIYQTLGTLFLKTNEEGAQTTLHCALCPREELELVVPVKGSGEETKVSPYFVECADKSTVSLLSYGWDVKEAEAIIDWGRKIVEKA
ncbi:short chain dehydrogenase, putative [Angomonas deanei]|uniref:Short chain dehydrogenase, putative n=1 Tax=Angomonas deanei TaxID=59799 RepID=A0A7G2CAP4_9TRYP|nr:short chain dehydrogenase, putative [Angomonas deanei]